MLFRKEALEAQQTRLHGDALISSPISISISVAFLVFFAIALLFFLRYASYTRYSAVRGQIVPESGVVRILAGRSGVLVKKYVAEGDLVKMGQALFEISDDKQADESGTSQVKITTNILARLISLRSDLENTSQLNAQEITVAKNNIANSQEKFDDLKRELSLQAGRVRLADRAAARYHELGKDEYVSNEQIDQKDADFIAEQEKIEIIRRGIADARGEIQKNETELESMSLKHSITISGIRREIDQANEELINSQYLQRTLLVAPRDGIVSGSANLANVGQPVSASDFLTAIIPTRSPFTAVLYVTSKDIGLIKLSDHVALHFDAFPYQKFGSQEGVISSIAKATTPLSNTWQQSLSGQTNDEPSYKVTVALKQDFITTNNMRLPMRVGMTLEAEIARDRRPLYQWIFDPIYAIQR